MKFTHFVKLSEMHRKLFEMMRNLFISNGSSLPK